MLRLAILGCGRIGQVHARTIKSLSNAKAVAVADAFPETAEKLAGELGAQVRSISQIMASDDVDAVIIGTPTDTHFDLIKQAANAGKAIFCEKPVDMSAKRIEELVALVEAAELPFLTAFNRRFDPNFAAVEKQIRLGAIGHVELVQITSRDPSPPPVSYIKSSGGLFRDMTVHDFDMARFLLAEEPVEVFAAGSALVDPEIGVAGDIDTAVITLKTASGKICQISNSRRATYGYDQRIEVHGSKGAIKAENQLENTVELATSAGYGRAPAQHFFLERYEAAYRNELVHFVTAVLEGTPPSPSIYDGLQAQRLADAAAKSLETGLPQCVSE
ncbi:inositol 2-dehydrogenase [Polycladidibacter hongkongensis]|uniref:inositol 2-dehydrogenase n=1 Tax=Polycladidibacter hongkongensis TaxID=1647556 RepID=UPI0008362BFE|nr:inositol 2-dehydrogenase [Pseudovibrio hongkongensis]